VGLIHIANGGVIYNKTTAQQIEIMTGVLREIKQRCDLYEGRQLNKNSFTNQITFLKDKNVTLKLKDNSKIEIPLNWSSKSMGNFSSKQWIREL
jgi:hypothetical protein